jgi:hypothetical protein
MELATYEPGTRTGGNMKIRLVMVISCLLAAAPVRAGMIAVQDAEEAISCDLQAIHMIVSPQFDGAGFPEPSNGCAEADASANDPRSPDATVPAARSETPTILSARAE